MGGSRNKRRGIQKRPIVGAAEARMRKNIKSERIVEKITTLLSKRTGSTPKNGRVANSGLGVELSGDGLGAMKIPPVSKRRHCKF